MRKIRQTRFGADDRNCFEACVASILELEDIEAVPRYTEPNARMNSYFARLDDWLGPQGLAVIAPNVGGDRAEVDFVGPDTWWIGQFATDGPDADHHHAIVMRGSEPAYDPQSGVQDPAADAPMRAAIFLVTR